MGKMLTSILVQHGQPWWTGSKCRFLGVTSMPSTVKQAMDQRLVQGMNYIYQEMQLSIITLSSAARTSVTQDRILEHSSREKNILQLQTTRCLDQSQITNQISLPRYDAINIIHHFNLACVSVKRN